MTFGLATDQQAPTRSVPPTAQAPRWRRGVSRAVTGWAFAGPATVLVIGLSIFPAVWAFLISRTKWNGIAPPRDLGWGNYETMTQDPQLSSSAVRPMVLPAVFVVSSILLGMLIAVALNRKIRFVA